MRIIKILDEDRATMAGISQDYASISLMHSNESEFLVALIREKNPKKVLEVGVFAGSSSVILLEALEKNKNSRLYSIDYATSIGECIDDERYRHVHDKKIGYIVDSYPHLKQNWQLFTGGLACNFMENVGGEIDFCVLDTMHQVPGEILDFLMVFPFLKKDATVILHDVNLQMSDENGQCTVNNMLISTLSGTKLILDSYNYPDTATVGLKTPLIDPIWGIPLYRNIAAVELNNQKDNLWDIFNLLTQQWMYIPSNKDIALMRGFFQKHYDNFFTQMFDDIVEYQKNKFMTRDRMEFNRLGCRDTLKILLAKIKDSIQKRLK